MINPFFTPHGENYPQRVYARLSQVEQSFEDKSVDELQFATVDARWLDQTDGNLVPLHGFAEAPLSIVAMERKVTKSAGFDWPNEGVADATAWVELTISDGKGVSLFPNL